MNTILARTAKPVIYSKSLRKLFEKTYTVIDKKTGEESSKTQHGSVLACILLQQLDYYTDGSEEGFYKFLSPCSNPAYRRGDSWTEELGFTEDEFRAAFSEIGKVWKSYSEFKNAKDKFEGKFYASYFDRIKGKTFYFRNHQLLDQKLSEVFEVDLRRQDISRYVNGDAPDTEMDEVNLSIIAENTPEITTEKGKEKINTREEEISHTESSVDIFAASDALHRFPMLQSEKLPIEKLNEIAEFFVYVTEKQGRRTLYEEVDWIKLCKKLSIEGMSFDGMKYLYKYCVEKEHCEVVTPKVMDWKFPKYKKFIEDLRGVAV